jgi:hypothetical protein
MKVNHYLKKENIKNYINDVVAHVSGCSFQIVVQKSKLKTGAFVNSKTGRVNPI